MKKVISLLLVSVICFGMCACSFVTKQAVIGTWEWRLASEPDKPMSTQYVFYKGGVGLVETGSDYSGNITWEIEDSVLRICLPNTRIDGYQYNPKEDIFTSVDGFYILVRVS